MFDEYEMSDDDWDAMEADKELNPSDNDEAFAEMYQSDLDY